jgi:hypothetical protein
MDHAEQVLAELKRRPGQTAIELARNIIGPTAVQPEINGVCAKLMKRGLIERKGIGGGNNPYRYYLKPQR